MVMELNKLSVLSVSLSLMLRSDLEAQHCRAGQEVRAVAAARGRRHVAAAPARRIIHLHIHRGPGAALVAECVFELGAKQSACWKASPSRHVT